MQGNRFSCKKVTFLIGFIILTYMYIIENDVL